MDTEPTLSAVPLIPRDVLFGNPERTNATISPDGTLLGFVAPVDGVLNVWVGPMDDIDAASPVTNDRGHGVRAFAFAHDDRTLLYLQDNDGDENWRVYAMDLVEGNARLCTPAGTVRATILGHNRWHPTKVLIGLNDREPSLHDVHALDLTTRQTRLVEENPGFAGWIIDSHLTVRGGIAVTPDGGQQIHLKGDDGRYALWREIPAEDAATTHVLGHVRDDSAILMLTSVEANTSRLVRIDTETGQEDVLAEHPVYDIGTAALDPVTLEPVAAVVYGDRQEWICLDSDLEEEIGYLRTHLPGELGISRRERSDTVWLVTDSPSDGPMGYYRYERGSRSLQHLFTHKPALEGYQLAPMEPFECTSRDGLTLHGYLTVPIDAPRDALPAVLVVHGGPWSRDTWGYDPEAQWLANRGYVCIQVNYRGSTGFGKDFLNAGDREWAAAMHTDLLDTVSHLASTGLIDADRVGIYGGSYGGYAALVGAAFTPESFRCAIDMVGPSNLLTLLASVPEYWKPMQAMMHRRVGDPASDADFLWRRSPLSRASDISIPLLIAQGKNDPRVTVAEADQIVSALRERDIPHEYLLFDDEGHGLAKPENRETFYAAAERFLADHLGGRTS